ncbi:hypothetical protein D3C72_1451450 [compost metagenome]
MDDAAIRADRGVVHDGILDRQLAHFVGDDLRVVALGRRHRFQVVVDARIHARLHHRRLGTLVERLEALGKRAAAVVVIPVKAVCVDEALGRVQPQRVHVGQEHEQGGQALVLAAADAEFARLLDGRYRVRAAVGQADHLRFRALRLHQEG